LRPRRPGLFDDVEEVDDIPDIMGLSTSFKPEADVPPWSQESCLHAQVMPRSSDQDEVVDAANDDAESEEFDREHIRSRCKAWVQSLESRKSPPWFSSLPLSIYASPFAGQAGGLEVVREEQPRADPPHPDTDVVIQQRECRQQQQQEVHAEQRVTDRLAPVHRDRTRDGGLRPEDDGRREMAATLRDDPSLSRGGDVSQLVPTIGADRVVRGDSAVASKEAKRSRDVVEPVKRRMDDSGCAAKSIATPGAAKSQPRRGAEPVKESATRLLEVVTAAKKCQAEGNRLLSVDNPFDAQLEYLRGAGELQDLPQHLLDQPARELRLSLLCSAIRAMLRCKIATLTDKALKMSEDAVALEPGNASAIFHRGCARSRSGQLDLAWGDFERVIAAEESDDSKVAGLQRLQKAASVEMAAIYERFEG